MYNLYFSFEIPHIMGSRIRAQSNQCLLSRGKPLLCYKTMAQHTMTWYMQTLYTQSTTRPTRIHNKNNSNVHLILFTKRIPTHSGCVGESLLYSLERLWRLQFVCSIKIVRPDGICSHVFNNKKERNKCTFV